MENSKIEFDTLQMYFGEPYTIDLPDADGAITVHQPTIGDIVLLGEKRFYSTLNIFITTTTSYRLQLWDAGIDWNNISNFDLFMMLYTGIDHEASRLIFGDLDFSNFKIVKKNTDDGEVITLFDEVDNIEINKSVYDLISKYLQAIFSMKSEEKLTTDPILKKWYIEKDRRQAKIDADKLAKGEEKQTSLQPIISACINHPGFKYNLQQLREIGVYQFYDSVARLQIYEQTTACLKGLYSGFVDGSKLKPDDYNFMK